MSKAHVPHRVIGGIAAERMERLMDLAVVARRQGRLDRAVRYVTLARLIGQKVREPMPDRSPFCKKCGMPLIQGMNCRVRANGGKISTTCLDCQSIKRMPYIKEQRK